MGEPEGVKDDLRGPEGVEGGPEGVKGDLRGSRGHLRTHLLFLR